MAEVFTLQSYEIADNWGWVSRFLDLVEDAPWKKADVKEALLAEHAQLWGARDGALPLGIWITKIENTGSTRWGLVWIAAGEPLEAGLKLFNEHTVPWMRSLGCEFVQLFGRKGWKKALPEYEDKGIILVRKLV